MAEHMADAETGVCVNCGLVVDLYEGRRTVCRKRKPLPSKTQVKGTLRAPDARPDWLPLPGRTRQDSPSGENWR